MIPMYYDIYSVLKKTRQQQAKPKQSVIVYNLEKKKKVEIPWNDFMNV